MRIRLLKKDELNFETSGLSELIGGEIVFRRTTLISKTYFEEVVDILINFMSDESFVHEGDTISIGMWLVKLVKINKNFEFLSINPMSSEFDLELSYAIDIWQQQKEFCAAFDLNFSPPKSHQLLVMSPTVLNQKIGVGKRYEAPDHMSGWWIIGKTEEINIDELKLIHPIHLDQTYAEIISRLALPVGFGPDDTGSCFRIRE